MDTAVTIPTGAMAERWKWSSFCIFGLFMALFVYPIFGNWVWGGGWLATLGSNFGLGHGHVDFAGSSVVHMVGGVAALAGAIVLGPRIGKFTKDGSRIAIPGHDIPMAITGTFILAFGWFGFNPGSTLAGGDLRIGVVAVNTMMAGTAGASSAMSIVWMKFGKPDPGMMVNGMLAGLVAITAPCAFVNSPVRRASSAASLACSWSSPCSSSSGRSRSTIRLARSRSTASTAPGACSRSASLPTALTATDGMACRAPSRACSTATPASSRRSASAR